MKRNVAIILLLLTLSTVFTGCSSNKSKSDENSNLDRVAFLMTIAQKSVDEYLADVKYPWGEKDWVFVDVNGVTSISTKVTLKDSSEKKLINVVATVSPDNEKYKVHFVGVGGKIYFDDGTID